MHTIRRNEIVAAWAVLVALTALSWWLGSDHGVTVALATTTILVVAFAKIAVIGHSFMELGAAAPALRIAFFGLTALICVTLVGLYLTS
jgi:heme/copper-type cytochrome/quinol oxidase subunit 4